MAGVFVRRLARQSSQVAASTRRLLAPSSSRSCAPSAGRGAVEEDVSGTDGESSKLIHMEDEYSAHNYHPLPVLFADAKGADLWDPEGRCYLDSLSAYSGVNQGQVQSFPSGFASTANTEPDHAIGVSNYCGQQTWLHSLPASVVGTVSNLHQTSERRTSKLQSQCPHSSPPLCSNACHRSLHLHPHHTTTNHLAIHSFASSFAPLRDCSHASPQVSGSAASVRSSSSQAAIDPFALVADELNLLAEKMREMVLSEVPKLASAAEYFFKKGAQGKRFRPTVLLLLASSLDYQQEAGSRLHGGGGGVAGRRESSCWVPLKENEEEGREGGAREAWRSPQEKRLRQQRVAEITEMIHVASLLHDDVLDHADTRRGIGSLNSVMGNKLAVLAGDFLLARASTALATLRNTEVVELLSGVLEHLVMGEIMQMTSEPQDCTSVDYYLQKTFLKTASLMANSCKAVAILGGHDETTAQLSFDYGRNLGLAFQLVDDSLDFTGTITSLGKPALNDIKQGLVTAPVLFAAEKWKELQPLMERKFRHPGDIEQAVKWVKDSDGVERTQALAAEHSERAIAAIHSLAPAQSNTARRCREGLIELANRVLTRST